MNTNDFSYALANPLEKLLDKPRGQFTRSDLLEVIRKLEIERLGFHYTASDGKLKELRLPVASSNQAELLLAEGERVDGSSLFRDMVDPALSDLYVVPLYHSAFVNPFESGSLDFICRYLTKDGELAPFAPDTILERAARVFHEHTGLELYAMGELEFFLIGESEHDIFQARKQHGYHAAAPYIKSGHILNEMIHHITRISGNVKYAHSEVGYIDRVRSDLPEIAGKYGEQLEIEYLPRPVLEAADSLVLGRWLIRNVAYRHGCVATFAPKIEEGVAGNGLHFHLALLRDGINVMSDAQGQHSPEALRLIGGLCRYAAALTAFGNTVSSAYLRLVPNQEAPTRVCWSDLNRSAMIRVPLGWSRVDDLARRVNPQQKEPYRRTRNRQTVELRSPDGSAMVHLVLAGMVMAADWGFLDDQALELAERFYVEGNIFADRQLMERLPQLPSSCVASSRVLIEQRQLFERDGVFPPSVIEYVARHLAAHQDEDMNRRLADLPADDRLHETRKIMHSCLHEQ
ncbi:MAG: glutamine synthetase [Deltaproteobacteria bacterium]|nr:MAG: glutamine synthetase [Deltaproteobacteria bacterium]